MIMLMLILTLAKILSIPCVALIVLWRLLIVPS